MKVSLLGVHSGRTRLLRPLFVARISAGFPSPAEDWVEGRLDLNTYLIRHPVATFYMRVIGDSMSDEFKDGDILIVDRACEVEHEDIAVVRIGTDFTVKKICFEDGKLFLVPANESYKTIEVTEESDFEVWGKVMWSVRPHNKSHAKHLCPVRLQ